MKRQLTVSLAQIAAASILITVAAHWSGAQEGALPPGEAAKAYARTKGPVGSAEYAAALRDGLSRATDLLDTTKESKTRSIWQHELTASNSDPSPVLGIDSDPDYVKWLEEQAGKDLYTELHLEGEEPFRTRSVGGSALPSKNLFTEVGVTAQVQPLAGYCSGVLMDRKTMLTAAHCMCQYKPGHVIFFGTSIRSKDRFAGKIKSIKARVHVECANDTSEWQSVRGNDIAVIRLEEEVPAGFVPNIAPIADPNLIRTEFSRLNRVLWTVGYGKTERNPPGDKNVSLVPMLSVDCSREGDRARYGCVPGKEILAKDPRAVGPCGGDSGGGAYIVVEQVVNGKAYKKPWLVGLVSGSARNPQVECGDAAIFTLLTKDALDWAKSNAID